MRGLRWFLLSSLAALAACEGRMTSTPPTPEPEQPSPRVDVTPTTAALLVGQQQAFVATLTALDGGVTWSLAEADAGVLTSAGLFTATGVGEFHVVATATSAPQVSGRATVTVSAPAVVSVSIAPRTAALPPGGTRTFTASVTGTADQRLAFSAPEGGAITPAGAFTAPMDAGVFHVVARSVAEPAAFDTATVTVTAPGQRQSWTAYTAGMVSAHFDNGYGGAFDASPAGRSDAFMVGGFDESDATALKVAFGVIGQPGPVPTARFVNPEGFALDYGSSWQDTERFDLHVVYGTFAGGIQYWRLHPQRTGAGGAITGFTATRFVIDGAKDISYPAIQEFVDGNGVKRLAIYGTSQGPGTTANLGLLMSTATAGVTPSSAADFTGPNGEAAAVTVGTLPVIAYITATGFAQHRVSRKLELFIAAGQHGSTGPQKLITLTPSGGGFTVGAARDLPVGIGDAFATAGLDDAVWYLWADASTVHLSQVSSAGVFTPEAVPTPEPNFEDYRGPRHLAVAPDGRLMVLWYLDSVTPARVRANVWDGRAWLGWLDTLPNPGTIFNYQPLQGLAQVGGQLWGGTVLSVSGAETLITAASF